MGGRRRARCERHHLASRSCQSASSARGVSDRSRRVCECCTEIQPPGMSLSLTFAARMGLNQVKISESTETSCRLASGSTNLPGQWLRCQVNGSNVCRVLRLRARERQGADAQEEDQGREGEDGSGGAGTAPTASSVLEPLPPIFGPTLTSFRCGICSARASFEYQHRNSPPLLTPETLLHFWHRETPTYDC